MSTALASSRQADPGTDYSLYLVTDSSDAILGGRDLLKVVEEALEGGVTIVQYREKKLEAKSMIEQAKKLLEICHKYSAKFIVNDRVDVAFAARADGVHLGQDDVSILDARKILGDKSIIGISCSTVNEALQAVKDGADYLGIGAVYATPTKTNVSGIVGISGVREIVSAVGKATKSSKHVPCVAIGGLNSTNIQLLKYKCHTPDGLLDGVAIVSAIMGATSPKSASQQLNDMFSSNAPWQYSPPKRLEPEELINRLGKIAAKMVATNPITHNMTNIVVANFTANVAIAAGASPIMSKAKEEALDLAKLGGGLVVNIGTSTTDEIPIFTAAMHAYNSLGGPVLLDPVGAGATQMRYKIVYELMDKAYIDIIKGNENELQALSSAFSGKQKGVDSSGESLDKIGKSTLVSTLAKRERCVVLMTGAVDYLSDGKQTYAISNGVASLGNITGSGCALGAIIVAFAAVCKEDKLLASLAAVLFYEIAAEIAQDNPMCQGPGNFIPCFVDALKHLNELCKDGNDDWLAKARVEEVDVA